MSRPLIGNRPRSRCSDGCFAAFVDPLRIGFDQRAGIGRQVAIAPLGQLLRAKKGTGKIDFGAVFAGDGATPAPHGGDDFLQIGKIILGMGDRQPIGDIGIGPAMDVRHTPFVAFDPHLARPHRIGNRSTRR